jgi:hypothetical protein
MEGELNIERLLLSLFKAKEIRKLERVQSLWSNYGSIDRYYLDKEPKSVIIKEIKIPVAETQGHPRGWNTQASHNRKIRSYEVEWKWYQEYAARCGSACRIAECYYSQLGQGGQVLVLEDLDAAGYPLRLEQLELEELKVCLAWLANFHAIFLQEKPKGLWKIGTYWHLATRQEEWEAMEASFLKEQAALIDQQLNGAKYQTLVHGDAKVANFCFSSDRQSVAAVDFQYVGAGCGMKDVIYLMSSCFTAEASERHEKEILDFYFDRLVQALSKKQQSIDFRALEQEWRLLYPYAWADFVRFLKGWAPEHQKLNFYSEKQVNLALELIDS